MELEINGIKADLGNASIAVTRRTFDVLDPEKRFIDITNSFNLPDTQVNRDIFNSPFAVNSTNDSFDVLYRVKIIEQFIIFNGYGILTDAKKKEGFRFQVVDKSKDVFTQLEADLTAMEWDAYDLILSAASKATVATEANTHPLCWPTVIYHEKKTSAKLALEYSRPMLYAPAMLALRLTEIGYTFTEPKKLAISLNHEDFLFTSYQKNITATLSGAITGLDTNDIAVDVTPASGSINIHTLKTRFRIRGAVEVTAGSLLTLTVTVTNPLTSDVETQDFVFTSTDTSIDFVTSDFQTDDPNLNVSFAISGGTVDFDGVLLYTLHSEKDREDLDTHPFENYKIKVQDNLPNITFKDLYRTLCLTTNSVHVIDSFSKSFTFKSFSGLQKIRALDWSDRFIQGSENIGSDTEGLANKNWLKYDNDLTVPRFLGADFFQTGNESIGDENDYIVLPFSASNEVLISGNTVASVDIYNDTQRVPDRTVNIRIVEVASGVSSFSGLDWKNMKILYANFFDSLERVRNVPCQLYLRKLDVLGWDLIQLVYIEHFSCYFIVEEISNFVAGLPTNVKLLKYG